MNAAGILFRSRIPFSISSGMIGVLVISVCLGVPAWSWAVQVSPSSLSFSATAGGTNPPAQAVGLSQTGTKKSNWSARADASWVSVTPGSGSITSGTVMISIGANIAALTPGTYSANVTIALKGGRAPQSTTLPVSLVVTSGSTTSTPVITLTPTMLSFSGMAGGSNLSAQAIGVTNTGTGTLSWTASDNAAWLALSPTSGTNAGTISASVNTTGLAAGTYSATVTVSATSATTKTVPVTLTLTSATSGTATLSWAANKETDLAGYKIYVGTQSGVYGAPIAVGNVTTYQATNLKMGTTYFFAITAYNAAGNESEYSAEVSKSIF